MNPDLTLFEPSSRPMKVEYPELATIPEFKLLTDSELKFVWLVSNKTSPIVKQYNLIEGIPKEQIMKMRISDAIDVVYKQRLSPEAREKMINNDLGAKVINAMKRMEGFIPSIRMKGKLMAETMLSNIEAMVSAKGVDMNDLSQRKMYVSIVKDSAGVLDDLIVKAEQAYGIKVKKTKGEAASKQPTLMDLALSGK